MSRPNTNRYIELNDGVTKIITIKAAPIARGGMTPAANLDFVLSHALGIVLGRLMWTTPFIDVRRIDHERKSRGGEQLAPACGGGREDEAHAGQSYRARCLECGWP